jgi:hypothetical protein
MMAPLALAALLVAPRRQPVSASAVGMTAIILILSSEPNARYSIPRCRCCSCRWPRSWAGPVASSHAGARAVCVCGSVLAINIYFLPSSSYYHKDFYGPFTDSQREAYLA